MLFKLSLKNIKKSMKDYSIYFFTLIFAVAMFYVFNSIDAQNSMLKLNSAKNELAQTLVVLMGYVSIFVSIILGFLIVYSNNFLIRKRKKEIGLYFTLGMSKRKVSAILVIETIVIGLISLVLGLTIGVFLSQFLSIFTAKLFEVDMTGFRFVFSTFALTKTMLYFGIIFLFVMIFNVVTLSRYKLIDLINASKKNEQIKIRNKYLIFATFVLAIGLIWYAYSLLFGGAILEPSVQTTIMLISGALGTFFLFFSLAGFLVKVIEKAREIYYKNLNMFVLKQVNNKINTSVFSTTVISLMLLLTIGILSGAMSLANVFNTGLKENNLADFTVRACENIYTTDGMGNYQEQKVVDNFDVERITRSDEFKNLLKDYTVFTKYVDDNLHIQDMMTSKDVEILKNEYGSQLSLKYNVSIMKESDYIALMNFFGKEVIDIGDNEYLLLANIDLVMNSFRDYYENKTGITVNGFKLIPASQNIIKTAIENYNTAGNEGIVVVSDNVVNGLKRIAIVIEGNYIETDDVEKLEKKVIDSIEKNTNVGIGISTKLSMEASSLGIKTMAIFIGLYLGITFAISSATVLAIGQLSEASDNKERYKILRQIGTDSKMINKALCTQILITFIFPLIVALFHSYFGLKEVNRIIVSVGNIDLTSNILLTAFFIVFVYGGYFALTYFCSKNIIKENA